MSFEEVQEAVDRRLPDYTFYTDYEDGQVAADIQYAYGWDDPDTNSQPDDYITRQRTLDNVWAVDDLMASW